MTDTRPVPYPAETRARGWRFELDMEKVKQSDTWLRAKTGEIRGALLLLWGESWQQTPCGTLPADDELVALIIDMPLAKFQKHRAVLMRGWWLAEDGRLYHDTIVDRVLAMLEKRAKDAERSANRRARQAAAAAPPDGITPASRVTHDGPGCEFDTKHQAPVIPSLRSGTRGRAAPPPPKPDDVTDQTWGDWLALRKAKRAPVSETVLSEAQREAVKAGMALERFLQIWVMRGSQGLQADWLRADERRPAPCANKHAAAAAGVFGSGRRRPTGEVIDV